MIKMDSCQTVNHQIRLFFSFVYLNMKTTRWNSLTAFHQTQETKKSRFSSNCKLAQYCCQTALTYWKGWELQNCGRLCTMWFEDKNLILHTNQKHTLEHNSFLPCLNSKNLIALSKLLTLLNRSMLQSGHSSCSSEHILTHD